MPSDAAEVFVNEGVEAVAVVVAPLADSGEEAAKLSGGGVFLRGHGVDYRVDSAPAMRVLNLGCGSKKLDFPEAVRASDVVGVDRAPGAHAEFVHDLNVFPYPIESNGFDLVILQDVVEHLNDLPAVLAEVHRTLRPGGIARIRTPHYSSIYAHNDPTHLRCYGVYVFQWFEREYPNDPYGSTRFRVRTREIEFPRVWRMLGVKWLVNRWPRRWEQLFAYVVRADNMTFELEAIK